MIFRPCPIARRISFIFSVRGRGNVIISDIATRVSKMPSGVTLTAKLISTGGDCGVLFGTSCPSLTACRSDLETASLRYQKRISMVKVIHDIDSGVRAKPNVLRLTICDRIGERTSKLVPSHAFRGVFCTKVGLFRALSGGPSLG